MIMSVCHVLFQTELRLKNVYYLYSACSNPTNVVLMIVLSMIIGVTEYRISKETKLVFLRLPNYCRATNQIGFVAHSYFPV
jgi:hypothetical protein